MANPKAKSNTMGPKEGEKGKEKGKEKIAQ
jgi:hypothetical protein